jgi:HEAT repeat protein
MLARRLDLHREVELELLAAASCDGDEQIVATAAAALGETATDSGRAAARALLAHAVPRVRANALDALLRAGRNNPAPDPPALTLAIELKDDPHHRVRAGALRGLLISETADQVSAAANIASMLADDRPLHRLAALWAVERALVGPIGSRVGALRWNELAVRVADAAGGDAEPPIRARAHRCARRMLARLRSGWAARAAGPESAA